jgi:hypothetical protein
VRPITAIDCDAKQTAAGDSVVKCYIKRFNRWRSGYLKLFGRAHGRFSEIEHKSFKMQRVASLLDHLVGVNEQSVRHREAERSSSLEVDQ